MNKFIVVLFSMLLFSSSLYSAPIKQGNCVYQGKYFIGVITSVNKKYVNVVGLISVEDKFYVQTFDTLTKWQIFWKYKVKKC